MSRYLQGFLPGCVSVWLSGVSAPSSVPQLPSEPHPWYSLDLMFLVSKQRGRRQDTSNSGAERLLGNDMHFPPTFHYSVGIPEFINASLFTLLWRGTSEEVNYNTVDHTHSPVTQLSVVSECVVVKSHLVLMWFSSLYRRDC